LAKKFVIVCGHYGCGKTNYSINLAINEAKKGEKVTLVDLDFVNPYFCSSGYKSELEKYGVNVISTAYANTNVDLPAVVPQMYSMFESEGVVVVDLGGDDAGSAVLGRFYDKLKNVNYEMRYVINKYRSLTTTADETIDILREIEEVTRCKATSIVNNSHLKQDTSIETVKNSIEYANEVAKKSNLPILYTTIPSNIYKDSDDKFYPVDIYVKTVWE